MREEEEEAGGEGEGGARLFGHVTPRQPLRTRRKTLSQNGGGDDFRPRTSTPYESSGARRKQQPPHPRREVRFSEEVLELPAEGSCCWPRVVVTPLEKQRRRMEAVEEPDGEGEPRYRLRSSAQRLPPTPHRRMRREEGEQHSPEESGEEEEEEEDEPSLTKVQSRTVNKNSNVQTQSGNANIFGIADDSELVRPAIRRSPRRGFPYGQVRDSTINEPEDKANEDIEYKPEIGNTSQIRSRQKLIKESPCFVQKLPDRDPKSAIKTKTQSMYTAAICVSDSNLHAPYLVV
ncbi:uncharacterized protein LOC121929778 [Sceloporus undulatus]|uniref:uncharacterized protein LOC121929778 n=1 Tax=Sceloporus undulatus TaxID=8520 RepID=UPI001C4C06BD|nr:uncharacterized protein LOC121929778 [Sceloporus undulatus]